MLWGLGHREISHVGRDNQSKALAFGGETDGRIGRGIRGFYEVGHSIIYGGEASTDARNAIAGDRRDPPAMYQSRLLSLDEPLRRG